jgi:hypothetical protein
MKTRILILITVITVVMFGIVKEATAQGKAIYFMKDGKVAYNSAIANIDSITFAAPPVLPILSVKPSALSFTKEATESHDVFVTTNQPSWDATSDQTWCTITKGANQFTVRATANTGDDRTATITVTAGKAPNVTIEVTQASLAPDIAFVANPIIEYLYTPDGFFDGSRVNFALIVYDAAGKTSITIQEVAIGVPATTIGTYGWNLRQGEIRQTRVIPISGPGTYPLSQEMRTGIAALDTYSQFVYTVSAHGKSYISNYTGVWIAYDGRWTHYFGIE